MTQPADIRVFIDYSIARHHPKMLTVSAPPGDADEFTPVTHINGDNRQIQIMGHLAQADEIRRYLPSGKLIRQIIATRIDQATPVQDFSIKPHEPKPPAPPIVILDEAHSIALNSTESTLAIQATSMFRKTRTETPGTPPSPIELAMALRTLTEATGDRNKAQEFLGQFTQNAESIRGTHPSMKRKNEFGWCEIACHPDEYRVEAYIGMHWWPDTYQQMWPKEPEHYSPEFDLCRQSNRHQKFEHAMTQAYCITKYLEPRNTWIGQIHEALQA